MYLTRLIFTTLKMLKSTYVWKSSLRMKLIIKAKRVEFFQAVIKGSIFCIYVYVYADLNVLNYLRKYKN